MKTPYLSLVVALFFHMPASATNWVEIGGNDAVTVKVDKDSMRRIGNRVKTWLKWEWAKPQDVEGTYPTKTYKVEKQLQISDCTNGTLAIAQGIQYAADDSGDVANSYIINEKQWRFSEAAPETIGESILQFACKSTAKQKSK